MCRRKGKGAAPFDAAPFRRNPCLFISELLGTIPSHVVAFRFRAIPSPLHAPVAVPLRVASQPVRAILGLSLSGRGLFFTSHSDSVHFRRSSCLSYALPYPLLVAHRHSVSARRTAVPVSSFSGRVYSLPFHVLSISLVSLPFRFAASPVLPSSVPCRRSTLRLSLPLPRSALPRSALSVRFGANPFPRESFRFRFKSRQGRFSRRAAVSVCRTACRFRFLSYRLGCRLCRICALLVVSVRIRLVSHPLEWVRSGS